MGMVEKQEAVAVAKSATGASIAGMSVIGKSVVGSTGIVTIDNPPRNALSPQLATALLQTLQDFDRDDAVNAVIITGVPGRFLTSSPPGAFDATDVPVAIVAAVEAMNKPVIAAVSGPALDIGLELCLACDVRLAAPDALAGLPHLMLGIPPNAGATQRLPRLLGIADAVALVGAPGALNAVAAVEIGLFDRVEPELMTSALALAETAGKQKLSQRAVPSGNAGLEKQGFDLVAKRSKGVTAVMETARLIGEAASVSFDEGVRREHDVHQRLFCSGEAKALQYLSQAEEWAKTVPGLYGVEPKNIERAAVVGAGTMGSGIAFSLASAGLPVIVLEQTPETANAGQERIAAILQAQLKSGRLSQAKAAEIDNRLLVTDDWSGVREVDLVIEAAFEDIAVKKAIFDRLHLLARPGTVLATNTSYLDVDAIAEATGRAADVVGLHFFSPAHIMRLLEVVQAEKTAPAVLATALALARRIGKLPIVSRVCDGFIGNRIFATYRRHAEYLIEDGASPEQIDDALQAYGFAMGPFAVSDMSGLDIAWAMRKRRAATRDPGERYVAIPDLLCEAGRLGRKTGGGWYDYSDGKRVPSVEAAAIIDAERDRQGAQPRSFAPEDIQKRILAVMVNEGAKVLEEGISARASDIDLVFVNGYGFPRLKGGPMFAADQLGLTAILADVEQAARVGGAGSEPSKLLVQLVREGRTFAEWQREARQGS